MAEIRLVRVATAYTNKLQYLDTDKDYFYRSGKKDKGDSSSTSVTGNEENPVTEWLTQHGFDEKIIKKFEDGKVESIEDLAYLKEANLVSLGLNSIGERIKFMRLVSERKPDDVKISLHNTNIKAPFTYDGSKAQFEMFLHFLLSTCGTYMGITINKLGSTMIERSNLNRNHSLFLNRLILENVTVEVSTQLKNLSGIQLVAKFLAVYGRKTTADAMIKLQQILAPPKVKNGTEAINYIDKTLEEIHAFAFSAELIVISGFLNVFKHQRFEYARDSIQRLDPRELPKHWDDIKALIQSAYDSMESIEQDDDFASENDFGDINEVSANGQIITKMLFDTGAKCSIFNEESFLSNMKSTNRSLTVYGGGSVTVDGTGLATAHIPDSTSKLRIKSAHLVRRGKNIFAPLQMANQRKFIKGFHLKFDDNSCIETTKGKNIPLTFIPNKGWFLEVTPEADI